MQGEGGGGVRVGGRGPLAGKRGVVFLLKVKNIVMGRYFVIKIIAGLIAGKNSLTAVYC